MIIFVVIDNKKNEEKNFIIKPNPFPFMSVDDKNMNDFLEQVANTLEKNTLEKKSLKEIESIPLSQNECVYVVDFNQNKLVFNKGFYNLLGYDDKEISIDFIENLFHPDDVELANRIIKASILYCLDHPENSSNNMLFISFRLRKKDGTYIKILSQSSIYDFDNTGRMTSTLIRFTDISFIDNTKNVNWDFKANNLNKKAFKEHIYKVYQNIFTGREIEIITEIEKGLTNKKIAENLKISEHTIATHRKHILKKANCHNSEDLMIFCRGKGII